MTTGQLVLLLEEQFEGIEGIRFVVGSNYYRMSDVQRVTFNDSLGEHEDAVFILRREISEDTWKE